MKPTSHLDEVYADGLVTVRQAAEFFNLSRSTIYGLMESGQLRYVKIGGARRIPKNALIELASSNEVGGWKLNHTKRSEAE